MIAKISASAARASSPSLCATAAKIHNTIARFTAETVPSVLHDAAHELGSQRVWQTFLGRRHTLFTSWLHLGVYELEFAEGVRPLYVEAVMPSTDGLVQIMEAGNQRRREGIRPSGERSESRTGKEGLEKGKHWSDDGVDVALYLVKEIMEKLVKDPLLRQYE